MPVWHERLKPAIDAGKVVLIGVIQEQHAERCQLFAQWKQWDWPILHDPINELSLDVVPVVVAIDEHGVVRDTRMQINEAKTFLEANFPKPLTSADRARKPTLDVLQTSANRQQPKKATEKLKWQADQRALGDALLLWGKSKSSSRYSRAIDAYRRAKPEAASDWFRLGVAYRMRFETEARHDTDFQAAVDAWSRALTLNPNQYIYRRRIQQYGPRLAKPYPFYDWVAAARKEIVQRGETPVELSVEPSGAEFAKPLRSIEQTAAQNDIPPDPNNRIRRDLTVTSIATTAVPSVVKPGGVARIHVQLRVQGKAHWNNEVEPMKVWVEPPIGWKLSTRLLRGLDVETPESRELRRFEFEIQAPKAAQVDPKSKATVRGYALFHACEEASGQCLYLRKDFAIPVGVKQE